MLETYIIHVIFYANVERQNLVRSELTVETLA